MPTESTFPLLIQAPLCPFAQPELTCAHEGAIDWMICYHTGDEIGICSCYCIGSEKRTREVP